MEQEIVCHRGKCVDNESLSARFDAIFDDSDIDQKIQKDLLKKSLRYKV